MLNLSEVIMQHHELDSFRQLLGVIRQYALDGEIHFRVEIKPPYPDTPEDWEEQLEMAFYEPNKA